VMNLGDGAGCSPDVTGQEELVQPATEPDDHAEQVNRKETAPKQTTPPARRSNGPAFSGQQQR
jgi:hypothetical protein